MEYLVYLPEGGSVTVDLTAACGRFSAEWFDASAGQPAGAVEVEGGGKVEVRAPFAGGAVLYLKGRDASGGGER